VNDKTFALSAYFHDPDNNVMEFCAWLPAYDQLGRDHEPASWASSLRWEGSPVIQVPMVGQPLA
jgi:hypothetical protein